MSQKMNAAQIAFIINECAEGVERSKFGPLFLKDPQGNLIKDPSGIPVCSQIGFQCFMNVLACYFPKNYSSDLNLGGTDV